MSRAASVAAGIWNGLSELASPWVQPEIPDTFAERDRIRRGRLLARFLVLSLLLDAVLLIGCLQFHALAPYAFPVGAGIVLQAACLFPNWLGRTELACLLYVAATLASCVLSLLAAPLETVYAGLMVYRFYVTAVVQAGFLVSRAAPILVAGITVVLFSAHVSANMVFYREIPVTGAVSIISLALLSALVLIGMAAMTSYTAAALETAVREADRAGVIDRENRDLLASKESLEVTVRDARAESNRLHEANSQLQAVQEQMLSSFRRLEETNRNLREQVGTDPLTGLANLRVFQDTLKVELELARTENVPLSLLMVDVDHFKQYNDQNGHPAGDEVLRAVAQALNEKVRTTDLAARYGGDEFVVLLGHTGVGAAYHAADRIRRTIGSYPFPFGQVTVSIGIATVGTRSGDAESLVREADAALYEAKQAGRNRIVIGSVSTLVNSQTAEPGE